LGPILLLVYINDLPRYVEGIKMVLYTDDTNIFVEYMEENALKLKLESVMKQLKVLFLNKELILNITKKSAMSFLSSQCRHP
jgi:hypothetical protein